MSVKVVRSGRILDIFEDRLKKISGQIVCERKREINEGSKF